MLQEPQIKRRKHQDHSDVHHQPQPKLMPEEEDVHADHDAYHREHVEHNGRLSTHRWFPLCATGVSTLSSLYPDRCATHLRRAIPDRSQSVPGGCWTVDTAKWGVR